MKPYKKTLIILIIMIMLSCSLSGCWDSIEINKRAFVLGAGIDKSQETNQKEVTYEIALPSQMAKGGTEEAKDGKGAATWDITKSSSMLMEINSTMNENIDRTVDLDHMQLLVIGSQMAKEGMLDSIDFFLRNPQVRRLTKVVYFDGKASDLLKIEPKTMKAPAIFISSILDNNVHYSNTIPISMDLSKVEQDIRAGLDFMLPRISVLDNQAKVDGGAAFKDAKFVSNVEEGEIGKIGWWQELVHTGNLEVPDPQIPTKKIVYGISDGSSKVKLIFGNNKVGFQLEVNVEGDLEEQENVNFLGALKPEYIKTLQKSIEDKMKNDIIDIYNKYERDKKVDVLRLKRKIKNYNNEFYEKNKDSLSDILAESDVEAKITAKIRRVGLTR